MTQGSVSDTDNFLFSRLPFSRSPSWGAEQTLFSPSSPQLEPCIRTEWARLRPWHSRLSQRFWIMREKNKMMMIVPYKHVARKALNGPLSNYLIWLFSVLVPPGCPDGCELRRYGLVFGVGSVVELGHQPHGFCCASEAKCCVPSPWGRPWHSLQPGRAGHTGSVTSTQFVISSQWHQRNLTHLWLRTPLSTERRIWG